MHIHMCSIKKSKWYCCARLGVFDMNRVPTDFTPQQPPVQFGDRPRCAVLRSHLAGMLPGTGSCFMMEHISTGRFLARFWDKQSFLLYGAFAALWTVYFGFIMLFSLNCIFFIMTTLSMTTLLFYS